MWVANQTQDLLHLDHSKYKKYYHNTLRGSRKYPYPHHRGNWVGGKGPGNSGDGGGGGGGGGIVSEITFPDSQVPCSAN